MPLEVFTGFYKDLVPTNPEGTDPKSEGDNHLRGIKFDMKTQWSGLTDGIEIAVTETQLNQIPDLIANYPIPPTPIVPPAYALRGRTANTAFVINTNSTFAHGLGELPKGLQLYMVCLTAQAGFVAGEVVLAMNQKAVSDALFTALSFDATNVYCRLDSDLRCTNKTATGNTTLTPSNWEFYIEFWA